MRASLLRYRIASRAFRDEDNSSGAEELAVEASVEPTEEVSGRIVVDLQYTKT